MGELSRAEAVMAGVYAPAVRGSGDGGAVCVGAVMWGVCGQVKMLNQLFTAFDNLVDKHGVYKVETIGDGDPSPQPHESSTPKQDKRA